MKNKFKILGLSIAMLVLSSLALNAQDFEFTPDRQLHAGAGAFFGSAGYVLTYNLTEGDRFASYFGGTATATFVGLVKEVSDSRAGGSGFDGTDLLFTTIGGFVSSVVTDLIMSKYTYKERQQLILERYKRRDQAREEHELERMERKLKKQLNKNQ